MLCAFLHYVRSQAVIKITFAKFNLIVNALLQVYIKSRVQFRMEISDDKLLPEDSRAFGSLVFDSK